MNQTLGQMCNYPSPGGWRSLGLYERLEPINKWSVNSIHYTAETAGDSAWHPLSSHRKMIWTSWQDSAEDEVVKWICVNGQNRALYYISYKDYTVKCGWWIRSNFKPSNFFSPTNWEVGQPGLSQNNDTKVVNYVLSSRVHREDLKCAKENNCCL